MVLFYFVTVIVFANLAVDALLWRTRPPGTRTEYQVTCYNLTNNPLFDNGMVVGKPWRTYYGWNLYLGELCMDMKFKYSDPSTVKRVKENFISWKTEPSWSEAVLYLSMGESHGMLLLKDGSHIPGRFFGVPNTLRHPDDEEPRQDMFKMTMKLIHKGRYLLVSDCSNGATSLLLRPDGRPKREEINAVATSLNFGDPFPACTNEPDPEDEPEPTTESIDEDS